MNGTIVLAALAAFNFIPAIIAHARGHHSRLAITVLCIFNLISAVISTFMPLIFFGTATAWIVGTIWACTGVRKDMQHA
jgi:hypothetical protein